MSHDPNVSDADTVKGLRNAIAAMAALTLVLIIGANIFFGA